MREELFTFTFLLSLAAFTCLFVVYVLKEPVVACLITLRRTSRKRLRADDLPALRLAMRLRIISKVFLFKKPFNYEAVTVEIRGQEVQIDYRLAGTIRRLNESGIETAFCCQGCHTNNDLKQTRWISLHGQSSYLMVAATVEFPQSLIGAIIKSGLAWNIGHQSIHTVAAYTYDEELFAINRTFIKLLDDWAEDAIDGSGEKYRAHYIHELQTLLSENKDAAPRDSREVLCDYCLTEGAANVPAQQLRGER